MNVGSPAVLALFNGGIFQPPHCASYTPVAIYVYGIFSPLYVHFIQVLELLNLCKLLTLCLTSDMQNHYFHSMEMPLLSRHQHLDTYSFYCTSHSSATLIASNITYSRVSKNRIERLVPQSDLCGVYVIIGNSTELISKYSLLTVTQSSCEENSSPLYFEVDVSI
ncbi:hypothetical protein FF38_10657 [Lucilia cuprina]|uniref:Uncharacterized protein n=1 Tax=Lucilia cuprina TaxID=7375 RepID=A0A0L0CDD3_LUCCU|nr:hypothetical protein FF38_10657 [Lucilia cuprina]